MPTVANRACGGSKHLTSKVWANGRDADMTGADECGSNISIEDKMDGSNWSVGMNCPRRRSLVPILELGCPQTGRLFAQQIAERHGVGRVEDGQ